MYRGIFRKSTNDTVYHYITIRDNKNVNNTRRIPFTSYRQVDTILYQQKDYQDIFITKYGSDKVVDTVILDFDSESDKQLAYNEVDKLKQYLMDNGLNSIIVDSTNKGYHLYIQIPPKGFMIGDTERDCNRLFNIFVNELINNRVFDFKYLDGTNTSAGLGGNIRLLESIHPKTGESVRIIKGIFKEMPECYGAGSKGYAYVYETLEKSYNILEQLLVKEQETKKAYAEKVKAAGYGNDFIKDNDLRELMPRIFGGEHKKYPKGYVFMTCPFHNDSHPSLLVTKEWFSCNGCGAKGNIWKLHEEGHIDLFDNE